MMDTRSPVQLEIVDGPGTRTPNLVIKSSAQHMSRRAVSCRSVLKSQDKAGGSCPVVPRHIEPFAGKLVGRHERRRKHASGVETR